MLMKSLGLLDGSEESERDLPDSNLFCAACDKFFKTSNA